MEPTINVSNATSEAFDVYAVYRLPHWVASEIITSMITVLAGYMLLRVYRHSYPYCVLNMKARNGKIYYRLCVATVLSLFLTSASLSLVLLPLITKSDKDLCTTAFRVLSLVDAFCLQIFSVSLWFQQHCFSVHPIIRSKPVHHLVKWAQKVVFCLVMLVFPILLFVFVVGEAISPVIEATPTGCVIHLENSTPSMAFQIYVFFVLFGVMALFIPSYLAFKRKLAENLGSSIEDGFEAKTFFMEHTTSVLQYVCLLFLLRYRLTIRPSFGGHVSFLKIVLRERQKMPKCPPFRHYEQ